MNFKAFTLPAVCGVLLTTAACQPNYDNHYPNEPEYMKGDKHSAKKMHMFNRMDANGDGVISVGENNLFAKTTFVEADVNRDGAVSYNEFLGYHDTMKRGHHNARTNGYVEPAVKSNQPYSYGGRWNPKHDAYDNDMYYNNRYDNTVRR